MSAADRAVIERENITVIDYALSSEPGRNPVFARP